MKVDFACDEKDCVFNAGGSCNAKEVVLTPPHFHRGGWECHTYEEREELEEEG